VLFGIIILWLDIEGLPGQLNQIQSTVFFSSAQHIWASSMAIFSIVHHSTDMLQVLFPAGIPSCPPCQPFWFRWSNLAHKNQNFLHWFVTTWNLIWMHKNVPYFIMIFYLSLKMEMHLFSRYLVIMEEMVINWNVSSVLFVDWLCLSLRYARIHMMDRETSRYYLQLVLFFREYAGGLHIFPLRCESFLQRLRSWGEPC